jgi:hypothetical protein
VNEMAGVRFGVGAESSPPSPSPPPLSFLLFDRSEKEIMPVEADLKNFLSLSSMDLSGLVLVLVPVYLDEATSLW